MSKTVWTYWRGEWREGATRVLSAASHGSWLGSVVFDGARLFEGVTPDLDRHCERVNASARALMLEPTKTSAEIEALALEGLKHFAPDAAVYVKPMYWAEDSAPGILPPDPSSTEFAISLEVMPMPEPTGFSISLSPFRRPTPDVMPVEAKAACLYANNSRMMREAQRRGFQNALVLDANGNVAETASSNIFMVRDGEVLTPTPNGTFLDGITRQRVIELLRADGVVVHEITLSVADFHAADEIFSTGNASKVVPITGLEERKLDYGPIARRARALYWDWAHSRR